MKTATRNLIILLGSVALMACAGDNPGDSGDGDGDGDGDNDNGIPDTNSNDNDNDFEHNFSPFDAYADSAGISDEVLAGWHSCNKVPTATLARVLASRGVDLNNQANLSAGDIFRDNQVALGLANYETRVSESAIPSASGLTKLYDTVIAAAPEIIAAMPTLEACNRVGEPAISMFTADGSACTADGIKCLTGAVPQPAHIDICNQVIARASTQAIGQEMAVALLFGSALTCE